MLKVGKKVGLLFFIALVAIHRLDVVGAQSLDWSQDGEAQLSTSLSGSNFQPTFGNSYPDGMATKETSHSSEEPSESSDSSDSIDSPEPSSLSSSESTSSTATTPAPTSAQPNVQQVNNSVVVNITFGNNVDQAQQAPTQAQQQVPSLVPGQAADRAFLTQAPPPMQTPPPLETPPPVQTPLTQATLPSQAPQQINAPVGGGASIIINAAAPIPVQTQPPAIDPSQVAAAVMAAMSSQSSTERTIFVTKTSTSTSTRSRSSTSKEKSTVVRIHTETASRTDEPDETVVVVQSTTVTSISISTSYAPTGSSSQ